MRPEKAKFRKNERRPLSDAHASSASSVCWQRKPFFFFCREISLIPPAVLVLQGSLLTSEEEEEEEEEGLFKANAVK